MEKVRLGSNIIAMSTPPPKRNSMQTLRAPSGHLQGNHRHKSMSLSSSQSPVNAISIRNFCPQLEAASVLGSTGDNRKDATTEGGMRFNLFRTGGTFAIVRFDFDIRDERPTHHPKAKPQLSCRALEWVREAFQVSIPGGWTTGSASPT